MHALLKRKRKKSTSRDGGALFPKISLLNLREDTVNVGLGTDDNAGNLVVSYGLQLARRASTLARRMVYSRHHQQPGQQ